MHRSIRHSDPIPLNVIAPPPVCGCGRTLVDGVCPDKCGRVYRRGPAVVFNVSDPRVRLDEMDGPARTTPRDGYGARLFMFEVASRVVQR